MKKYSFKQIDVFTTRPFYGNPVAVVLDAGSLGESDMQRIAAWTNLSETTFLLPATTPKADYRLRIFTPKGELPFAGHPTIGSAHAFLEHCANPSTQSTLVQECAAGLIELKVGGVGVDRRIRIQIPTPKISTVSESVRQRITTALRIDNLKRPYPLLIDVGPVWLVVNLGRADTVHSLKPDILAIESLSRDLEMTGITVFGLTNAGTCKVYTRSFAPAYGAAEDPVCGSGNACVAAFLVNAEMTELTGTSFIANQGNEVGRNGFIDIEIKEPDSGITIGGASVTCIDGCLRA